MKSEKVPMKKERENKSRSPFLGFWHYGVILTYLSAAAGVVGIFLSITLSPFWGCICLYISALCDSFDGMVAGTRKNRTEQDKKFGMQIDSLSDLIAFVIAPVCIGFGMGLNSWYFIILYCIFVISGLARLGYYNVSEEERAAAEGGKRKYFEGLPVAIDVIVLPIAYLITTMLDIPLFTAIFMALCYGVMAFFFVFRFRMIKAGPKLLLFTFFAVAAVITALALVRTFVFGVPLV